VKRAELESAAFWERDVCFDCDAEFETADRDEGCCPECGSGLVVNAALAILVLDRIEAE
jgi:hypothetical protein